MTRTRDFHELLKNLARFLSSAILNLMLKCHFVPNGIKIRKRRGNEVNLNSESPPRDFQLLSVTIKRD